MAAVTLKDLMDPLSKIAAAAEATNEKLDAFVAMATGASGGAGLEQAIYTQLETQTTYLKLIYENTKGRGLGGIFSGKSSKKEVSSAGKTLQALGLGAKATAQGMLLWMLVPSKAVNKFIDFVTRTYEVLAEQDQKKVKKGVNILDMMGGAIKSFALGLAVSALVIIPSMIAIPFLAVSIAAMGLVFTLLGKRDKQIKKGARAVDKMGDAMKSFAIGLAFFALTAALIIMAPVVLVGMVASLVLIGGAFALLGSKKFAKQIRKGAAAVALIGLGLIVFSVGLGIFRLATAGMGLMDVLIQSAVILGIGIATALVGKFGISNIAQGAAALALNGIGLIIFSLGYVPFAKATKGMGVGDILVQSGILLAVGGIMALAGLAVAATSGAALLGPLLFAAAGGALLLLAPGLKAMKDLDYSEQDAKDLATVLGGVAMAFSGIDPEAGAFGMLKGLFTRVVQSGGGLAAAAMYAAAGVALQTLSKGLTDFKAVGFDEDDSKELAVALGAVSSAFAQAGGEPSSPGGLFGAVFGNTFSPNATERGIKSVMKAGDALTGIAKGLTEFQKLVNSKIVFGDPNNPTEGTLAYAVINTVGFVQKAFAAIGGEEKVESGGFFKSLFGIKSTKTEEGIRSVMDAGSALTEIATGLEAFKGLKDPVATASKITEVLGFVQEAFAAIGGEEKTESGGFFKSLVGIKSTKTEEGIRSVKGAGDELVKIGTALEKFKGLKNPEETASKITEVLGFVQEAFAAIGGEKKVKSGGFFKSLVGIKSTATEEGIRSVKGAGDELIKIGTALEKFTGLTNPEETASKIKQVLVMVGEAFATIGGEKTTGSLNPFKWNQNKVEKGIDAVKGASEELTNIAQGLAKFEELKDPEAVAKGIESIFTSIGDTFTYYYEKEEFKNDLDHMRGFITELGMNAEKGYLEKAADGMEKIAAAINKIDPYKAEVFSKLFSSAGTLSSNRRAQKELIKAIKEIKDILKDEGGGGGLLSGLNNIGDTGGEDRGEDRSSSDARLNATLSRIDSTLSRLPSQIQAIKIEVSPDYN